GHGASRQSEDCGAAERGERFVLEEKVQIGADGVFVADRKVADLARVVEHHKAREIAEIKIASRESNPFGCAIAAYYGGAVIGGVPGALVGGAVGKDT